MSQPPAILPIPAVSMRYLLVPVTADVALGDQQIELAFLPGSTVPTSNTTWSAAAWTGTDVITTLPDGSVVHTRPCRVLLGSAPALTPGLYTVYARPHADPELPAIYSGPIRIV